MVREREREKERERETDRQREKKREEKREERMNKILSEGPLKNDSNCEKLLSKIKKINKK